MSKSHRSSHASESCRLEWRPSRLLCAALIALGVLGAASTLASDLPRLWACGLGFAAVAHAIALARRERRKPVRAIVWDGRAGTVAIDGMLVSGATLRWRGPLAFLCCRDRDGRMLRLAWWPDTLPPRLRRELRLAAGPAQAAPHRPSMAP